MTVPERTRTVCFKEAAGIHRRKPCPMTVPERTRTVCFNEAAGIHRRKPCPMTVPERTRTVCFNEAAGIHRRKPAGRQPMKDLVWRASMRPPEFTGGNPLSGVRMDSMRNGRFNEAAGIHRRKPRRGGPSALMTSCALQ